MSLQHFGKATLRVAKNYTKGYSDVQAKVREATSNDPWGPSGAQMNDISQLTYNQNDFIEVMEMLDKRLNDKGKNWRHVFKALTLLDYLLHAGSENVVLYFRDNIYIVKTLKEFQYVDEYGKDMGANVRQKAKDITNLLQDESRLREERRNRAHMRDRLVNGQEPDYDIENENFSRRSRSVAPPERKPTKPVDDDLTKAIEASKRSLAEEQAKKNILSAEERDLAKAIQLSEEEEARRNKALEDANARALFDDQAQNDNLLFLDTAAPQPSYPGGPQFTSFNPYQQQLEQQQAQAEYARQQAEWERQQQEAALQAQAAFLAQQQQEEWARLQQQQQQQLQQQQQQLQQQQQQEEWNRQQQLLLLQQQQQQQLLAAQQASFSPQPSTFGSNNPFALTQGPAQSPVSNSSGISFNLPSTFASSPAPSRFTPDTSSSLHASSPIRSQSTRPTPTPTKTDGQHAHLANLLANREGGIDTFGNVGDLRFGATQAGRQLLAQNNTQSAHNPFSQYQQQQSSEQPFFTV